MPVLYAFNTGYSFKNDLSLKWDLHWYTQIFYKSQVFFAYTKSLLAFWYEVYDFSTFHWIFIALPHWDFCSVCQPHFIQCGFSLRLDFWVEIIFHKKEKILLSLGNNDQFKMICTVLKNHRYGKSWYLICCWISESFRKVCVINDSSWL